MKNIRSIAITFALAATGVYINAQTKPLTIDPNHIHESPITVGSGATGCYELMSLHDAPIIVSDNSVRITFNQYYAFSPASKVDRAPHLYADSDPQVLLAHTHSSAPQYAGSCTSSKGKGRYSLSVTQNGVTQAPFNLDDCDVIRYYLDTQKFGIWWPAWLVSWSSPNDPQIEISKHYVPVAKFNHPAPCPTVASAGPPDVSQEQSWVVVHSKSVSFNAPVSAPPVGFAVESTQKFRIRRIEVFGPNGTRKYGPINASNGSTSAAIGLATN